MRSRSSHERTGTRKVRPTDETVPVRQRSNVVSLAPAPKTTTRAPGYPPPPAPNYPPLPPAPAVIGANEQSVIARFEQLGTDDPALIMRCRALAQVLDDRERMASWPAACKQLDLMLDRTAAGRKLKSRGRLAAIVAMQGGERKRTGT